MKKELTAQRGSNGVMRYHFDGKSIGIKNAVKLIEDYCTTTGADYELYVNVAIVENKSAQKLLALSVTDLAKVEWVKGPACFEDFMKPVETENGVEFIPDEKKTAEAKATRQISSIIYDVKQCKDAEKEQAYYEELTKLAEEYPHIFLQNLETKKVFSKEYADWSKYTGRPNVLDKLEEIAKSIQFNAEDDGSNDDLEEDFLTSYDAEISEVEDTEDELVDAPAVENQVTFPVVPDQFAALELADDYFNNLHISGKLTKNNGVLTAINGNDIQVAIHDDHLAITGENVNLRIDYDIAESDFCAALREVTLKAISEGKVQDTFEIVGKSGLIYTYTESTLKPIRTETPEEYNARVNSTPKEIKAPDAESVAKVDALWKILRQKQQALKAVMNENNIVAARKYSVKIAEIKLIVDAINNLTNKKNVV